MKKANAIIYAVMVAVMVVFLMVDPRAFASDSVSYPSIVTALATAFNLSVADVAKVFEADRQARETTCETTAQLNLSSALAAGTITQAQYDAITSATTEMKEARASLRTVGQELASQSPSVDLNALLGGPCGGPGGSGPPPQR